MPQFRISIFVSRVVKSFTDSILSSQKRRVNSYERQQFSHIQRMIRLGTFWDAAEPKPGRIDYAYLEHIKKIVQACETQGIYVILDIHQDLFTQKYIHSGL